MSTVSQSRPDRLDRTFEPTGSNYHWDWYLFISHIISLKNQAQTHIPSVIIRLDGQSGLMCGAPLRRRLARHLFETGVERGFCIEADRLAHIDDCVSALDQ